MEKRLGVGDKMAPIETCTGNSKSAERIDVDGLSNLIAGYTYGQFNILDNGMKIEYNSESRYIKFSPFYHHDSRTTNGSCGELMIAAYRNIRAKFPEYHVTRVTGNDPDFFAHPKSNHCFFGEHCK